MFMVFKKKKIVIYTIILFSVVCCCLSINNITIKKHQGHDTLSVSLKSDGDSQNLMPGEALAVSGKNSYFFKTKNDKEIARSKSIELLKDIINDPNSNQSVKTDAEYKLIEISNYVEKELKIESILAAKGLDETVVFISDTLTTITVNSNELSQKDAAKINDIALEITGNNNIKIVEVKKNMWYNISWYITVFVM